MSDPSPSAIDPGAETAFRTRVTREVTEGLLPSCQYAIARHGELLVHESLGEGSTPDDRYVVFSITKAFTAGLVWTLLEAGELSLDTRAAEVVEEFGTNGKEVVTVLHLLTHTGGFPTAPLGPGRWDTTQGRREAFARWRLNWEPGTRFEYHPTSGHWVLAEMCAEICGTNFATALMDRVVTPLGLGGFGIGPAAPANPGGSIRDLAAVGSPPEPGELRSLFGIDELPMTDITPETLLEYNRPEVRSIAVPGAGGIATAADVALYYQALLGHRPGPWSAAFAAEATRGVRCTLPDPLWNFPANRSLGLVVAGDDGNATFRGLGSTVSPEAFGHNGAGGQIAWGDPATDLSFCYLTNGLDRNLLREGRRTVSLASKAGALASPEG